MDTTLILSVGATLQDGRVVLLVGIGQQPPAFITCLPSQVEANKQLLTRLHKLLKRQGAQVTPEQICAIASRGTSFTDSAALANASTHSLS